jgi:hypothetical protein
LTIRLIYVFRNCDASAGASAVSAVRALANGSGFSCTSQR